MPTIGPFFALLHVEMIDDCLFHGDESVPIPDLEYREIAASTEFVEKYGIGHETPLDYEVSHENCIYALGLSGGWHDDTGWMFRQGWRPGQTILIQYDYWWASWHTPDGKDYDCALEWNELDSWGGWTDEQIADWLERYELAVSVAATERDR